MDPYQILGLARGCTREEVKRAFRARAWDAHPDRGGEEQPFIDLCAANKHILGELSRGPQPASLPGPGSPARPRRTGAERRPGGRVRSRPRADRPQSPPSPEWVPDLVLDAEGRANGPSRPPSPDWDPELVVLDEASEPAAGGSLSAGGLEEGFVPWVRRFSERAADEGTFWQSTPVQAVGVFLVLTALAANVWLCWAVWDLEGKDDAAPAAPGPTLAK
jgi:hypothetical protein